MAKVVYNNCYGGFSLSIAALQRLADLGFQPAIDFFKGEEYFDYRLIPRHSPLLISVVEELGSAANGLCALLKIDELYGSIYKIEDYDGKEEVIEAGSDWIVAM